MAQLRATHDNRVVRRTTLEANMKKPFRLDSDVNGAARNSERDVQREIELHLELRAREFEALGLSPDAARQAALKAFGDRAAIQHEVTDLRVTTIKERHRRDWIAELRQDISVGWRGLRRAPSFTIIALLTLGIGIGANTAIFSVLRSVILRPLPYVQPEQLVQVWTDHRALGRAEPEWLNPPDFFDWRDSNHTFSAMAAYQGWGPDLTGSGDPESLTGALVSGNFFQMLGAKSARGRTLSMADDDAGAEPVVMLSDALWQRRFGSDTAILGRQLTLNGTPWTVVGVLPPDFRAPLQAAPEIFRALRRPANSGCGRGCFSIRVIGRLKPNVTVEQASADLGRIAAQEAKDFPRTNDKVGVWLVPLHQQLTGENKTALLTLAGAVAFVLLIGCVNLANLLLVRGAGRTRELGVRAALGAGQQRIVRQLLTENALLAVTGGALGFVIGVVGSRVLATRVPESIRRVQDIRIDATVLMFAAAITLLAAFLFGLLPAIHLARSNLMTSLRSGGRATGRRSNALRGGLVVAQLSLAVVLLVGAGLLLKSFLLLQRADLGYRNSGVAMAAIAFPPARYPDAARGKLALEDLLSRLRANASVRAAEITTIRPLSVGDLDIDGVPVGEPPNPNLPPSLWFRAVSPGYLATMHMRLIAGRQFTVQDRDAGSLVGIVNEEVAQRYFSGKNAVGRVIAMGRDSDARKITIVGVVANSRQDGPNQPYKVELFVPFAQFPSRAMILVIEPSGSMPAANAALRQSLHETDPLIPMPAVQTINALLGNTIALPRLYAMLVSVFSVMALLLAALGVYGVMGYAVAQRQREIGVRLALGAAPSEIRRMVMGQGGRLALIGVALGIVASLLLGKLVSALLFGVTAFDAPTIGTVSLLLAGMTLLASWIPARRAMRVDPLAAIRND